MKKKTLIFAVTISLLATSFLCGCRVDTKDSASESTTETVPITKVPAAESTAAETAKATVPLTEDRLAGTWICESGFVCSYSDGVFIDKKGTQYSDCTITEDGISGVSNQGMQLVDIGIRILADDTLEVDGTIAVKADSDTGKQYQSDLEKQLQGDWLFCDGLAISSEAYCRIADGKYSVVPISGETSGEETSDELDRSAEYTFENGLLTFISNGDESAADQFYYVWIEGDVVSLSLCSYQFYLYRKDSKAAEDMQSGKSLLLGDWIFVSNDNSEIVHWHFDADETLSMEGYGNQEVEDSQKYSISRQNNELLLVIDEEEYSVVALPSLDGNCFGLFNGEECYGALYSAESQDGLKNIEKAKTIYSTGEMVSRTYSQNSTIPEIKSISLTLDCMSNVWLEDAITVTENSSRNADDNVCGASFQIDCTEELKNASITFTYNPDQFPYNYEEDLSVACIDSQTDSIKLIPTKIDTVHGTATAEIKKEGTYALVDSYVFEGGTRDISELNPSCSSWARNCDTGDILSLIDLDYIRKSNGNFFVTNASELASAVYYVNTCDTVLTIISIENDIDLSDYAWAPMGWEDMGEEYPFSGWINGNNHTINGLTIDSENNDVGLIGWGLCSVHDLTLTNASVSGFGNVGVLTGQAIGGEYTNCHADGSVQGASAGSLLGYEANVNKQNCTANVTVNGEKFDYLSWNEKEKSEIVIEDPVTITMDDEYTVTRPEVTGYQNLEWTVVYNGEVVLQRLAEDEYSYQYFRNDTGTYEIYLSAYVSGQYVPISNVLTYTIG